MLKHEIYFGAEYHMLNKAKELRKNMTPAEKQLWDKLRNKQLSGYIFRRQHPIKRFIADFYCHSVKLVIEVDGDIHQYQKEYDEGRTEELNDLGITVIRFNNEQIFSDIDSVINRIDAEIKNLVEYPP